MDQEKRYQKLLPCIGYYSFAEETLKKRIEWINTHSEHSKYNFYLIYQPNELLIKLFLFGLL